MGLQYFSFDDLWSPAFMMLMLAVIVLYTFVVGPWRTRFAGSSPVPAVRQLSFILAIVLLYLAEGGPLSLLGHLMFTFHMTNMAIAYMVVPPLLLYGVPAWLWRAVLRPRRLEIAMNREDWRGVAVRGVVSVLRFASHPIVAMALFVLLFSFYHMPGNHDWIMTHFTVHRLYYAALFLSAMMMWWHVFPPVAEWRRIGPLLGLGYIFMSGLLLTPACAMIIFASEPMFGTYSDPQVWARAMGYCVGAGDASLLLERFEGPAFFNLLGARDDQQLGGIVMKLVQEAVNVVALYIVFMKWYRRERARENDPDAVPETAGTLEVNGANG